MIEIHGHRGSRGTHPENTLAGFAEAHAAGADFFELDIQWSADDTPFVFHDPTINEIPLRTLSADTLKQRNVPTLDEVLRWQKGAGKIGVNAEIKMDGNPPDPEFCGRQVVELLRTHGLLGRAQVQSFDFRPLRTVKKLAPTLRLSCLFDEPADFLGEALAVGANIIGPRYPLLDKGIVSACHAKGVKVMPWTVNDPAAWNALVAMGVDGIITDVPRKLKAWLAAR